MHCRPIGGGAVVPATVAGRASGGGGTRLGRLDGPGRPTPGAQGMTGPHPAGTTHTAGSPRPSDASTRTPPGTASSRKRQPCSSPGTVQPANVACQGRCAAIQRSSPPRPSKAARAARASASVMVGYAPPAFGAARRWSGSRRPVPNGQPGRRRCRARRGCARAAGICVAWICRESSRFRHLRRVATLKFSHHFKDLADPCNKVPRCSNGCRRPNQSPGPALPRNQRALASWEHLHAKHARPSAYS
jgi:hypothetical protein